MTACAACGAENPTTSRFCGSCGAALGGMACPSCGVRNPTDHRFCGQCGAALPAATGATAIAATPLPLDERKLATVLFADVVGFTSMAERTDPETVARTVDASFRRMGEVVVDHGGTVDKYMGDSLMAVFGVPVAHADDAERAVSAALAMRELGGDLAFSIGINSGPVMATAVGRDGEVTVIGDTVNVAARLEKAAGAGEVLVGRVTAELAGERVVFRERQPVVLKGKRDPVEVWEAVALRIAGAPTSNGRLPLVGREDELSFLRAQWRRTVRDRRTNVLLLCGDAGVGTTRLVDELADELGDEALVVRAVYPAYGGLGGPRVAAEIIRQLGPMGDTHVDARVRSITGELHPSLRAIDPAAIQNEQLWAFRRLVESKAAERPILLVIDDIHRAGDKTIELLGELVQRVVDVPLLLVLVGRPEPSEWLTQFPSATTVRLGPLGPVDAEALASALLPDAPLSDDAAAALVQRAGGNPLYVRELVRVLQERGALVKDGGEYGLAGGFTLPPSLHAILAARLDALAPAEKLVLQHVAVLGDAATEEQVAALGIGAGSGESLHALVRAGLLHQGGDACYDVADPLLREVAYETLPRHLRGSIHRQAAAVSGAAVDRARHLDRAVRYLPDDEELQAEAAAALVAAGNELLAGYRLTDGIDLLLRAVELGHADPQDIIRLARSLGDQGRMTEVLAVLEHLPEDGTDDWLHAERLHIAAAAHMFQDPAAALEGFEQVTGLWAEIGDRDKLAWAHGNSGVALFFLGRPREAEHHLRTALDLFRELDDGDGVMACYRFLSLVRPDDERVGDWLRESLEHAEQVGDRTAQINSLNALGWHHFIRARLGGDADVSTAMGYARRLADSALELGMTEFAVQGLSQASNLARLNGHFEEAEQLAAEAGRLDQVSDPSRVLVDAVSFSAAVARGEKASPPLFDESAVDPVVLIAGYLVAEELLFAGYGDETMLLLLDRLGGSFGTLQAVIGGFGSGLTLLLLGRYEEARRHFEAARSGAALVDAGPVGAAARALLAEVDVRTGGDPAQANADLDAIEPVPGGIAGAMVLRARAVAGDAEAARRFAERVAALRAPGLARGMEVAG